MADNRNRPDSKKATNDWLTPLALVQACAGGELAGVVETTAHGDEHVRLEPRYRYDLFDLDPCAYPRMPWRTARTMVSNKAPRKLRKGSLRRGVPADIVADGLSIDWGAYGRKFVNPPWDDPLPWAKKMALAGNGFFLAAAKSTDTRWAQVILEAADAILFFKGRLLYCFPNGVQSTHGWTPSMLAAFGEENVRALERVRRLYPGVTMVNADKKETKI
jgi:hypothetical protein